MNIDSKKDLSVYTFISNLFASDTIVKVVDEFPQEVLTIPTIAVVGDEIVAVPYELGNTHRLHYKVWFIHIFAKNKTQRDEMGYKILDALENTIPVYNFGDEGFFPDASPSVIGCLETADVRLQPIPIPSDYDIKKLYQRSVVSFEASYNQI